MKKVLMFILIVSYLLMYGGCSMSPSHRNNFPVTSTQESVLVTNVPTYETKAQTPAANSNTEFNVKEYNEKFKIVDSPTTKGDIPSTMDVVYGKVEERECTEKWENSLIRQYKALFMAMVSLDFETYKRYFYSYAIEYCQKHFEHLSTEKRLMDNFMEEMKPLENYINNLVAAHLNVEAVVPSFIRYVDYNNEMFVAFNTSINICTDKLYTHQKQCIPFLGISTDGGKHWSFMAYDETADIILKSRFSDDVVDAIMGY